MPAPRRFRRRRIIRDACTIAAFAAIVLAGYAAIAARHGLL